MKIYTKTGDDGTTGLFNGARVKKSNIRVELYGTTDELNSIIGLATSSTPNSKINNHLEIINNWIFNLGSDLATPLNPPPKFDVPRINEKNINWLETKIDEYDKSLEPLKTFILPGGCKQSAFLHQARTVCRRAERICVDLSQNEDLGSYSLKFLNRLSDYLFTAARYANFLHDIEDKKWNKDI
ncbi:cob(I)yrinic acid a,c-diamide adenosyltransferase [Candidatus Kapabacteria bacterium]|nr:cob(I)yrinic acid a,c-diamide adenosyltransferase [Candidatus Kapabacteria bacterium]